MFDQVFVWILCHTSTFIGIKEDVINVKRCGNKRIVVCTVGIFDTSVLDHIVGGSKAADSPQAFIKRTKFEVNLNFVILKSDEWKGKSWVAAVPELKRNVKSMKF